MKNYDRIFVIVLDSLGIGAMMGVYLIFLGNLSDFVVQIPAVANPSACRYHNTLYLLPE